VGKNSYLPKKTWQISIFLNNSDYEKNQPLNCFNLLGENEAICTTAAKITSHKSRHKNEEAGCLIIEEW